MRHGGDLRQAIADYGIPADGWFDLSTGINPTSYPAGTPAAGIHRLADALAKVL